MILTTTAALGYPLVIKFKHGGWRRWVCAIPACIVFLIDILANYTELALLTWDWPRKGEYTFSTRLARLQFDTGWRGRIAKLAIAYTNHFDHAGRHI